MAITIAGTIMGERQSRKATPPRRLCVRATPSAAIAAISNVIAAVAKPMPKERIMAPSQSGEAANCSNQRRLRLGGGKDRNDEPVNAIGTKAMIGTSRIAIIVQ